jgi:sterol desaturase/sphingolipid hydroxylase (fatty acid hydroxylase superfamily)
VVTVALLALFWAWESYRPLFDPGRQRWPHAGRNLALAVVNTVALALAFGTLTVWVAGWAEENKFGLLHQVDVGGVLGLVLAIVLFDAWMYVWHRANHEIPLLWRFHRMHHSDDRMDVTTATRFHIGELAISSLLRLAVIPLLGLAAWHVIVYETLAIAVTQFHHANISLGRFDRWLRWLVVTPDMHKVHHSRWRPETDSNYATLLPLWDYLARTFRMRADLATLHFGLDEFADPRWQTLPGMLQTPFVPGHERAPAQGNEPARS